MIKFTIPVKTVSPNRVRGNSKLAAIITARRKAKERNAAKLCALAALAEQLPWVVGGTGFVFGHVTVRFVRLSAGQLDQVNLAASLKAVEDGVAEVMQIDDGSVFWRATYGQRKCKRGAYGVEVEIA